MLTYLFVIFLNNSAQSFKDEQTKRVSQRKKTLNRWLRRLFIWILESWLPESFFTEELEESENGEVLKNVYIYGFQSVEDNPDYPMNFLLNPITYCGVYDKEGNFLYDNEPSEGHFYIENYEGAELDVYEFDPF